MSIVKQFIKFPYRATIKDGLKIVGDRFDISRFDEAFEFYNDSSLQGEGYAAHEVQYDYLKKTFSEGEVIGVTNEATNELMAVIPFYDSPMCRSNKGLLSAVMAMVNPKHRGKGIAVEQYKMFIKYSMQIGYIGALARATITGRNILPSRQSGATCMGVIPYCTYLEKQGYTDDVLLYMDYRLRDTDNDYYKSIVEKHNKPLPDLVKSPEIPELLKPTKEYEAVELKTDNGMVRLRSAESAEEIYHVESLWRSAAETGQGFALDEFTEQGYLNRRFFQASNVIIAEDAKGEILGASINGPSTLSRAPKPVLATLYCTVDPAHRRKGIGRILLENGQNHLRKEGYRGAISDNFVNNHAMLGLLDKLGYMFLGSFPKCAYVKNIGVLDSIVVYKDLK